MDSDEDNIPLNMLIQNKSDQTMSEDSELDNTDLDPDYFPLCEIDNCKNFTFLQLVKFALLIFVVIM